MIIIKSIKSNLLYFVLLITVSPVSSAITLYRGDTRPPEEIFQNGFQSLGSSTDLIRHISGASCHAGTANSNYVSTSASSVSAYDFASEGASAEGHEFFYIYEIESDSSYIDVVATLRRAHEIPGYTAPQRVILGNLAGQADGEDEVLSQFLILASSVIRVQIYRTDTEQLIETRENPNFVRGSNEPPQPLADEFYMQFLPPSSVSNATMAWYESESGSESDSSSVTACFMGGACSSSSDKKSAKCFQAEVPPVIQISLFEGDVL
ncbi:NAD+ ADP-ribosyltransferase activity [Vibrio sp. B1FIG11]|uniref:scabin-related ADP-ribosyltransferase n=1 Tax=Vibrio sp. B1FIG11 TaxID=2751177 RepID=UPI001AF4BE9A|nr:enterotoxin A family protein [Vibrio sp. B1FIG11]CAD7826923.1 NAD+ ADP-ribosyltransferase activity [Vibrio sp. B1FIG11]CAE6962161.1 NAD+ ADP-ribosyltransferase activity [Vibrio sp. B1FIG11]